MDIKARVGRRRPVRRRARGDRPGAEDARRRRQGPAQEPNVEALAAGVANLRRHIRNVAKFGIVPGRGHQQVRHGHPRGTGLAAGLVCGRRRPGGRGRCLGPRAAAATAVTSSPRKWPRQSMRRTASSTCTRWNCRVEDKIRTIAQEIYGADGVDFSVPALKRLAEIEKNGWSGLPVCMAKTQYSFTDDAVQAGCAQGIHDPCPRPDPQDRSWFHRGADRSGDDHARPAQGTGRDAHGRRR